MLKHGNLHGSILQDFCRVIWEGEFTFRSLSMSNTVGSEVFQFQLLPLYLRFIRNIWQSAIYYPINISICVVQYNTSQFTIRFHQSKSNPYFNRCGDWRFTIQYVSAPEFMIWNLLITISYLYCACLTRCSNHSYMLVCNVCNVCNLTALGTVWGSICCS